MCLRFVFLLIMQLTGWLRLSRHKETWKTAEISESVNLGGAPVGGYY
jgi:hypothetical protein